MDKKSIEQLENKGGTIHEITEVLDDYKEWSDEAWEEFLEQVKSIKNKFY